jgi:hypothetical protein
VHGRSVTLPEYRNGVARASFADLCERPLGPGDYLALAEAVDVLILSDIPVLTPAKSNEAKRFVTLIDALYEARVRLIASAAAPPQALYPEGRGAFEFQRTVSRLEEMRSADWQHRGLSGGASCYVGVSAVPRSLAPRDGSAGVRPPRPRRALRRTFVIGSECGSVALRREA